MLSVKRIRNRHYHIDLAREDYYLAGGEPPGQWYGNGATALGLTGPVEKATLLHLMDGFSADGCTKLVQNAGREREIGWDFTLSAPKTVSVLWSQADPRTRRTIQTIHEKAIKKTLDWLEKQARTRRGKGGSRQESVQLISALFEHGTSRELDPQLHHHCLLLNLGVRQDGTTGAIQIDQLLQHKMIAGALYRAELAKQLASQLGYEIGPHIKGNDTLFDLKNVDAKLVNTFSKRRQEIEARLNVRAENSAIAASVAVLNTRQVKVDISCRETLFGIWQEIGREFGYVTPPPRFTRHNPENQKQTASNEALASLEKQRDMFAQSDLLRAVAECVPKHGLGIQEIEAATAERLAQTDIINLGKIKGETHYTTRSQRELKNLLTTVLSTAQNEIAKLPELAAGTLTRLSLKKAKPALTAQGYQLLGIAPRKTALQLRDEIGIKTYTPHRYLRKLHDQQLTPESSTLLVIDSAEELPVPLLAQIASEKGAAKLLLLATADENIALTQPRKLNPAMTPLQAEKSARDAREK